MKLKPRLIRLANLSLCFAIFIACSKDKLKTSNDTGSSDSPLRSEFVFSELNYIGENHNSLLDYVKENLDLSTASKYDRYLKAKQFTNSSPNWSMFQGTSEAAYNHSMESGWSGIAVENEYLDPALSHYLDSLEKIFSEAIDQVNNTFMPIDDFENRVNTLIGQIIETEDYQYDPSTTSGNDVAKLLGALVLAKYTYSYWVTSALDESNEWNQLFTSGLGGIYRVSACDFCKKVWRAIRVAATDVWGFMSCPSCGCGPCPGGYDLGAAWEYAGEVSNNVP